MTSKPSEVGETMAGLAPHIWNLQVLGLCHLPMHSKKKPFYYRWFHEFHVALSFSLMFFFTLQEIIYCVQVRTELDKVMEVSFIMLTHFNIIPKLLIFKFRIDRLQLIIQTLDGASYTRHPAHTTFVQETTVEMRRLLRAFTGAAAATCTLWYIFPYVDRYNGVFVGFPTWVPAVLDTTKSPLFDFYSLYSFIQNIQLAYVGTTIDVFICTIYSFCRTHLTMLRYNLENLPETCENISRSTGENIEVVIKREFEKCMEHHNVVIAVCKELQDLFGSVLLLQLIVCCWIICMTAYKITDLNPASVQAWSMILYMMCVLVELFMFCYYGNELTVESEQLVQSAYSMNFLQTPIRHRKNMLLFMERAKRAIRLNTGSIIPLSLSMPTIVSIMKSSYTFYAVLRQTKK